MLDFRHETFLNLCKIGNFTKTAEHLHITQPAVTQHIKYLEEHYSCKLFLYENKKLSLTAQGEMLYDCVSTTSSDYNRLQKMLSSNSPYICPIKFGATLTIGEYIIPKLLEKIMSAYPTLSLIATIDNTEILLHKLKEGKIDFALLEGHFDKSQYSSKIISKQEFIAVCSSKSKLKNKTLSLCELTSQRVIIREPGSGTRGIFEQVLLEQNLSFNSFNCICEIGNMGAIKKLVEHDCGITFMYKAAVEDEIKNGNLFKLNIIDFNISREFNFVSLKNSLHEEIYAKWYQEFLSIDV